MITREQKDKLYREYLAGVAREGRKGAMEKPLKKAYWEANFKLAVDQKLGSKVNYSNTELRKVNKLMVNSSKDQLTRRQRNSWEGAFENDSWEQKVLESGEKPEIIGDVRQILKDLGYYDEQGLSHREWLNFYGAEFLRQLEGLGLKDWSIFFNS